MAILKSNSALYPKYKGIDRLGASEFNRFKRIIMALVKSGHINTKPVKIKGVTVKVEIPKSSLEHALNVRGSLSKCKSITVIRELLKYSFVTSVDADKSNAGLQVLKLENMISIDGVVWKVLMYVKQGANNRYYYHHDLTRYKKAE